MVCGVPFSESRQQYNFLLPDKDLLTSSSLKLWAMTSAARESVVGDICRCTALQRQSATKTDSAYASRLVRPFGRTVRSLMCHVWHLCVDR
mmetsp:Transcript_51267/g.92147  ORF Transcript_51267/g.92147 Transcript_51267/m.92147 type:complete len:91 (+) Transcript_51267:543-815(+)